MNRPLLLCVTIFSLLGAGCFEPENGPITTFDECVDRGYPVAAALGECRAHQIIFKKSAR